MGNVTRNQQMWSLVSVSDRQKGGKGAGTWPWDRIMKEPEVCNMGGKG